MTGQFTSPRFAPLFRARSALTAACLGGVLASLLAACSARAGDEKLPSGEQVMDRYVEATGGKAAYKKLYNRKMAGTYEFVDENMVGTVLIFQARPNKFWSRFDQEMFGAIVSITDGEHVWMQNRRGVYNREGDAAAAMLHEALFDAACDWRKLYKKAECTGVKEVDGRPCYVVVLTPVDLPQPRTHYYDKETGLLTMTEVLNPDPGGDFTVTKKLSEYKRVDGVLMPFREDISLGTEHRVRQFDTIEHNIDIPADKFTKPVGRTEGPADKAKKELEEEARKEREKEAAGKDAKTGDAEKKPESGKADEAKDKKPEAKPDKPKPDSDKPKDGGKKGDEKKPD